jgi:hypothetical protein
LKVLDGHDDAPGFFDTPMKPDADERSGHFNLVGTNHLPQRFHNCMLGQLFRVVRVGVTQQNQALVSEQQAEVAHPPADLTSDMLLGPRQLLGRQGVNPVRTWLTVHREPPRSVSLDRGTIQAISVPGQKDDESP